MAHSFITCLADYRKKHGIKGGKAPKKGTAEYKAVIAMMDKPAKPMKKDGDKK